MKYGPLRSWGASQEGWRRLLRAAEKYEEAHIQLQAEQFGEAFAGLQESVALRLFPFSSQHLGAIWQAGLTGSGRIFRRPRQELANKGTQRGLS